MLLMNPPYKLITERCIGCETMADEQRQAAKNEEHRYNLSWKRA